LKPIAIAEEDASNRQHIAEEDASNRQHSGEDQPPETLEDVCDYDFNVFHKNKINH
jgi:hypothetical protein